MGKSWDQFWHFDEAAYAQDVAKLNPQQLTELHGIIRRKVISTTTGAGFGVVSAPATGGLSLVASGVSGRQRAVNGRRLKIIEARITQIDADRYKTRKRDYMIPIGVGTAGIGIATGLEDTFYDQFGSQEAVYAAKAATEVGVEHAAEAAHKHASSTPETVKANGTLVNPPYTAAPAVGNVVPYGSVGIPSTPAPNGPIPHSGLMPSVPSPSPSPSPRPHPHPHPGALPTFPGPPSQPQYLPPPAQVSVPIPTKPSPALYPSHSSDTTFATHTTGGNSGLLQPPPPPPPPRPSSPSLPYGDPPSQVPGLPPRPSSAMANTIPPPAVIPTPASVPAPATIPHTNSIPPPPSVPHPNSIPPPPSVPPPPAVPPLPPKIALCTADQAEEKIPAAEADGDLIHRLVDDIESYLTLHTEGPPPTYDSAISDGDKIVVVDAADHFDAVKADGGKVATVDTKTHITRVPVPDQIPNTYNPASHALPSGAGDEKLKIKAYNPAEYQPLGGSAGTGVPAIPTYNPAAWS